MIVPNDALKTNKHNPTAALNPTLEQVPMLPLALLHTFFENQ